jgi:hypothetical protein
METKLSTIAVTANESLESFRQGVDNLLAKRSYFVSKILPLLKEDSDYFIIKGKRSLSKGGSENLCAIYNLTASFEKDRDAMDAFSDVKGFIAFVCTLSRNGQVVGQGRGGDTLARNQNDVNKTLKMAQKRAYTDAAIRTTGLSDIFTQDMEDMTEAVVNIPSQENEPSSDFNFNKIFSSPSYVVPERAKEDNNAVTLKQKNLLMSLIERKITDDDERQGMLDQIESLDKTTASEMIQELMTAPNYNY